MVRAANPEASIRATESDRLTTTTVLRRALVALAPALIAFAGEAAVLASVGSRWLLMVAAVIVSAAHGGMVSGLIATIVSTVLVWWFLVPPISSLGVAAPASYLSALVFVAIGYAVSVMHERLRRTSERLASTAHQNQIFAALIDNSLDFIGIADRDGRPVYLNPAGRRLVAFPDDGDIGQARIADFYPRELRDFAENVVLTRLRTQGKWTGETSLRNWRTDAPIPVLTANFLIRDRTTGRAIGMATITRDISAQKAQRDELEQANQRLATAMRDLAASQRFLQGILDYSPNAIVIKSLDGRYMIVNNGFSSILGREPATARGRSDAELFPPPLASRLRANDERAITTRRSVVTEESFELDGDHRAFVVTKFPLFDNASSIFALCSIWTDITQRKHAEETLRQVANDLRAAQHVAHVGSWRWDAKTQQVEWSDEMYHIFDLDPSEQRRKALFLDPDAGILTEESFRRARAAFQKTMTDGTPYDLDLEFRRPDGSIGWVGTRAEAVRDESGSIVAINGTSADITRLKELQRLRDEWTSVIAHDLRQPISTIMMASDVLPELRHQPMTDAERALVERIHTASRALKRMVDDLLDMSLLEADRLKLERQWTDPLALVHDTIEHLGHLPGIERVHVAVDVDLSPFFVDPMRIEQVLTNLISNAIKYGDAKAEITIRLTRDRGYEEIDVINRGPGIAPEEVPRLFERFVRATRSDGAGVRGLGLGLYIARGVVQAHGGRLWVESTPGSETTFHVALPISSDVLPLS